MMRVYLESVVFPEQHIQKSRYLDVHRALKRMRRLTGTDIEPLGWHAHFGLVLSTAREGYRAIDLEPEALARPLPPALNERVCFPIDTDIYLCGSVQLDGGRLALVYDGFAILLGPDSATARAVGGDPQVGQLRLLGATKSGAVAACRESWSEYSRFRREHRYLTFAQEATGGVPVEADFLNIGPTGVSVSGYGSRAFTSDGPGTQRALWDAEELRRALGGRTILRVEDALCLDEQNWVCALLACHHPSTEFLLVGRIGGGTVSLPIAEAPSDWKCRIESFANGLVSFRVGPVKNYGDWSHHSSHLYDLTAPGLACPHPDGPSEYRWRVGSPQQPTFIEGTCLGPHEDTAYLAPLLGVSREWVLLLGYRTRLPFDGVDLPRNGGYRSWGGPRQGRFKDQVFAAYRYRVGSLEPPSRVEGVNLTRRLSLVDRSPGLADVRELHRNRYSGRTYVRVLRLAVDANFGVRGRPDQLPPFDLGPGVADATDVGPQLLAVAYESSPFRVEILRLPATESEAVTRVAVGYLAEPPRQLMLARGQGRLCLAVSNGAAVVWFDLSGVRGV
jgi:hypothetical protein